MSSQELPIELDCEAVDQLRTAEEKILFLDCREPDEYEIARIEGTTLLPMSEMQARIDELEPMRQMRIVVHCHHGGRSLRVARWLRSQGFESAQSMAGGIDAWSQRISPDVPRY